MSLRGAERAATPDATSSTASTPETRSPLERLSAAVCAVALCAAVAVPLYVAARRIHHPYELEWMEGGMLAEVRRVLDGRPLYTAPSLDWTPYLYPPLYVWVSAAVARITTLGLPTLRLVSLVATLATGAALYALVWRETRDRFAGFVAVGLFAATYRISGAWFDLARVDLLFVALLTTGLAVARFATRPSGAAFAALLLVGATATKQAGLLPAFALLPWMAMRGRRMLLTYALVSGGLLVGATAWLQASTRGWFLYYVWEMPRGHETARGVATAFWTDDLLAALPSALLLGGLAFVSLRRGEPSTRTGWFYGPVVLALVGAAYFSRLHTGGYDNVLLPAYVAVAIVAGIGFARARRHGATVARIGAHALVVAQVAMLAYSPGRQVPRPDAAAAGDRLVAGLAGLPEPVYFPAQPWLLHEAGRTGPAAQSAAINDVLRAHTGEPTARLREELAHAIATRRFCAVVVNRPRRYSYLPRDFDRHYVRGGTLLRPGELEPVTGTVTVPWEVWYPRDDPPHCRVGIVLDGVKSGDRRGTRSDGADGNQPLPYQPASP